MSDKLKQIHDLEKEVARHRDLYYRGVPDLTDPEYDALERRLLQLDPDNAVANSVGAPSTFHSVKHNTPMLSLDKEYDFDSLVAFFKGHALLAQPKLDGCAIDLHYEDGKLVRGATRGRGGLTGSDITNHVKHVANIPLTLPLPFTGNIRGEATLSPSRFETERKAIFALVKQGKAKEADVPKSPRNYGTASFMTGDCTMPAKRGLRFISYWISSEEKEFDRELEKITYLKGLGFDVPECFVLRDDTSEKRFKQIIELVQKMQKDKKREYDLDGVVFKINDIAKQEELGTTAKHPRYAKAFKWESETGATIMRHLEVKIGTTGRMTFTAVCDPVKLSDANCSRFTLHNAEWIKSRKIALGDTLHVTRAGEVIPKVLKVLKHNGRKCTLPTNCPICGSDLEWDSCDLMCRNEKCEGRSLKLLEHFVHVVDIKELGSSILLALHEKGLARKPADLYRLSKGQLSRLVRESGGLVGPTVATKVLRNIENSKEMSMATLLASIGIKGLGKTKGAKLETIYKSDLQTFIDAMSSKEGAKALMRNDGFGYATTAEIATGVQAKKSQIKDLLRVGVKLLKPEKPLSDKLKGSTFVITGSLSCPREDLAKLVKQHGGAVSNSVSSKTSYLLAGTNTGATKTEKAAKCGTTIIDEDEFWHLLK